MAGWAELEGIGGKLRILRVYDFGLKRSWTRALQECPVQAAMKGARMRLAK